MSTRTLEDRLADAPVRTDAEGHDYLKITVAERDEIMAQLNEAGAALPWWRIMLIAAGSVAFYALVRDVVWPALQMLCRAGYGGC
ncbi:hypothetical protein ACRAVF_34050 (plasmid) [Bradyrhizobium oligotrophicum S58]